jgi:hypothetical protein
LSALQHFPQASNPRIDAAASLYGTAKLLIKSKLNPLASHELLRGGIIF